MQSIIRMFRSSSGYFGYVRCPKLDHCKLPHCIFSHGVKRSISTDVSTPELKDANKLLKKPKISNDIVSAAETIMTPASGKDLGIWTPKTLPGVGAPATIQQRIKYITALISAYQKHKLPLPKLRAVEEEYNIAVKSTKTTYGSNIKILIKNANMGSFISTKDKKPEKVLSHSEIYKAVKDLVHTLEKLERNQYITKIPVDYSFKVENRDLKKCDHCSEQFYLSRIEDIVTCQYHERRKRFITKGGERSAEWECCSEVVGTSQGCKHLSNHVFKAADPYEMHTLIPFRETPKAEKVKERIVGMDCEMGYTTRGMEVIRVTFMDYFSGDVLLDEIVRPSGKVLDLNTRWSGVSEIPDAAMTLDNVLDVIFDTTVDENTIIIGHGLENDLNALRLIHHNIVDTAILFPKSLTKKYALRDLAFQYLSRKIQTGEHSSEEDSLAAMDLVKLHVKNKKA